MLRTTSKWLLMALGVATLTPTYAALSGQAQGAAPTAHITIPRAAYDHKRLIVQQARLVWGIDAPTATFAAQIHQESLWRTDAVSRAGARGMAQIMPATGEWLVTVYRSLGEHEPMNPAWAVRAMITYDQHLYKLVAGADQCERFAKALSAYNGGLTWIGRDESLASAQGIDAAYWFGGVETVNAGRSQWALIENRAYPRRILFELESVYTDAGFGGGVCESRRVGKGAERDVPTQNTVGAGPRACPACPAAYGFAKWRLL